MLTTNLALGLAFLVSAKDLGSVAVARLARWENTETLQRCVLLGAALLCSLPLTSLAGLGLLRGSNMSLYYTAHRTHRRLNTNGIRDFWEETWSLPSTCTIEVPAFLRRAQVY